MLKVITVCGLGVGSSLILKMTCEKAFKQLNTKVDIEHWDMGTVKGKSFDLLVTTEAFKKNFTDLNNVVYMKSMVDVNEAREKLEIYLKGKGLI
jgi:PTS system ascorbate-specific IIB component